MQTTNLAVLYLCLLIPMLIFRCAPLLVLKGRDLDPRVRDALGLIPASAFAALVANDILQPGLWAESALHGLVPIAAALIVVPVAKKSGSLLLSAVVGMAAYALLGYAVSFVG